MWWWGVWGSHVVFGVVCFFFFVVLFFVVCFFFCGVLFFVVVWVFFVFIVFFFRIAG